MQQALFHSDTTNGNKKPRTQQFYEDVRREYRRLCEVKKNGVRLYHSDYILSELASKFYRAEKTIENIIFHRV